MYVCRKKKNYNVLVVDDTLLKPWWENSMHSFCGAVLVEFFAGIQNSALNAFACSKSVRREKIYRVKYQTGCNHVEYIRIREFHSMKNPQMFLSLSYWYKNMESQTFVRYCFLIFYCLFHRLRRKSSKRYIKSRTNAFDYARNGRLHLFHFSLNGKDFFLSFFSLFKFLYKNFFLF